jgi:hypothetical protein
MRLSPLLATTVACLAAPTEGKVLVGYLPNWISDYPSQVG